MRVVFIAVAALLLLVVPAMAGIVNGSFSSGQMDPWEVDLASSSLASNNAAITDYAGSSNVVQLLATNTYTWTAGQWQVDQPDGISQTAVGQTGIDLDPGTTALQFRAAALFDGPDAGNYGGSSLALPSMIVSLIYGYGHDTHGRPLLSTVSLGINNADWNSIRQIDLPGNVDMSIPVEIWITATSSISTTDSHDSADPKSITVTGYVDNFVFVPEPASMAMLLAGVLGMGTMAAIRRRRASARVTSRSFTNTGRVYRHNEEA